MTRAITFSSYAGSRLHLLEEQVKGQTQWAKNRDAEGALCQLAQWCCVMAADGAGNRRSRLEPNATIM